MSDRREFLSLLSTATSLELYIVKYRQWISRGTCLLFSLSTGMASLSGYIPDGVLLNAETQAPEEELRKKVIRDIFQR